MEFQLGDRVRVKCFLNGKTYHDGTIVSRCYHTSHWTVQFDDHDLGWTADAIRQYCACVSEGTGYGHTRDSRMELLEREAPIALDALSDAVDELTDELIALASGEDV